MLYKCKECGFVNQADKEPEKCSRCGNTNTMQQLSDEESDKIYASDMTNDIHMEIIELAMNIIYLCEEGIEINLDEQCFNIFNETKDKMWVVKQCIKAELANHVHNQKW